MVEKAAVVACDALSDVRKHRDAHGAKTALLPGLHSVLSVRKMRVDGTTDYLGADGFELRSFVGELTDFGGAHKREVQGPEKEDNILA